MVGDRTRWWTGPDASQRRSRRWCALVLLAVLTVGCEGRVTDSEQSATSHVLVELAETFNASDANRAGAPSPRRLTLYWKQGSEPSSDTTVQIDNLGRAQFTLTIPKGPTEFWAGATSESGTTLYWSPQRASNQVAADGFAVDVDLEPTFPIVELTFSPSVRVAKEDPRTVDISGRSISLTLSNERLAGGAGRLIEQTNVDLVWHAEHDPFVTVLPAAGILAPGDSLDVSIQAMPTNSAIGTEVVFRFAFGVADTLSRAVVVLAEPALTIEKLTNGNPQSRTFPGPDVMMGQGVRWEYVIQNNGTVELDILRVHDTEFLPGGVIAPLAPDCGALPKRLAPGSSLFCTAADVAVVGDYSNVALVEARSVFDSIIVVADTSYYRGVANPCDTCGTGTTPQGRAAGVRIQKRTTTASGAPLPGDSIVAGNPILWTYTVTNIGDSTLSHVAVHDQPEGAICSFPNTTLKKGGSVTCTRRGSAIQGLYANIGTVTARTPGNSAISASASSRYRGFVPVPDTAAIAIETTTNGLDADTPPGPEIVVGQLVRWAYEVTNIGNVALTDITVTDLDPSVTPDCPDLPSVLLPGHSVTCSFESTARLGPQGNEGVTSGVAPDGDTVTHIDPSHYLGVSASTAGVGS